MSEQPLQPACTKQEIQVNTTDLPLSCPMPDMLTWNAHPKVYMPIEKTGKETCPYCGTKYVFVGK